MEYNIILGIFAVMTLVAVLVVIYKMGYENGRHKERMVIIYMIANMTIEERSGVVWEYENILLEKLKKSW